MKEFGHLTKLTRTLYSGAEWPVQTEQWLLLQLHRGIAYLHAGSNTSEFQLGGVVVIPPQALVIIRASVLGEALLRGCAVNINSLTGVLTAAERIAFDSEARARSAPFKLLAAGEPLSQALTRCCDAANGLNLALRMGLLLALADWVMPWLQRPAQSYPAAEPTLKARLEEFLNRTPESELSELTLGEVASFLGCCERHASRVFHQLSGSSFRKYISDLRLKKACQMLVQADYKIIDVALESGHSSLALFNTNFKTRFRMTPSQWRSRHLAREGRSLAAGLPSAGF